MNLHLLLVLIVLTGLSGCGLLQQGYEDAVKVGKESVKLKHYHYDFNVVSEQFLNQTNLSDHNTFRMVIYQLSSDNLFKQASYYDLLTNADSVLKGELVKSDSRIIYPFDTQKIKNDLDNKTRYVGLVFFFNQPESNDKSWKILLPVKELNIFRNNYILVNGSVAQLKRKREMKNLIKQQKKAEKKATKEKKKQAKSAKKTAESLDE